jgi:FAD/FMN-containing dehydrogenase
VITRRTLLLRGAAALLVPALGDAAPLPRNRISALRDAVRGPVWAPGQSGYDHARVVFNTRWDGVKPPAVVRVRDWRDVIAVVRWADTYHVPLVSRSGGHGYNGNSTSASAVVVDIGGLDQVHYADGMATLGPGARLGDVYAKLAAHGVTVPAGSCPTVAVGGLVLGGGMGLAGRAMGLTLDRVRSFDVVGADGRRRRVDGDDDLFWALRGGGGSFGIVTAVRLRTRPVSTAAYFSIAYGDRDEALERWDAFAPGAPDALTSILSLTSSGATAFGQYLGSAASLRQLIRPLGGSPVVGSAPYLAVQRRWAGGGGGRSTFAASSLYVSRRLSAAGRRAFIAAADTGAGLLLDAYGGAIARVRPDATAFPHRDARFSVQILSYTSIPVARDRVRRARRLIAPYGAGAYANYADPDLAGPLRAYYGANLQRLQRIKRDVDPANRFRPKQGIT